MVAKNKQLRVLTGRWDISISTPPHPFQGSGDVMEQGYKRMQEPEKGRTTVSGHDVAVTQMNPQYLALPTQDFHKIKRITSLSTEEERDLPPSGLCE